MTFDPQLHHRRSLRLKEYNYNSAGAYFITICVQDRAEVLSTIQDFEVHLTLFGNIIQGIWERIPRQYDGVELDSFIVMPNHIHGILVLPDDDHPGSVRSRLSRVVGWFKMKSTWEIKLRNGVSELTLWQRNYFEHIVRSEAELERIRKNIEENPGRWAEDELNTASVSPTRQFLMYPAGPRPR